MKKYLFASVILTIILSSCGGTGTGSSQNGEPSKQTEAQTVAASKVPAASGKEFLEYNNSGLQMKLPKNIQYISENTDGTSFIYDTEQSRYFIFAVSRADISKETWSGSLQALNDHFIAESGLEGISKLEKENASPPKGLENISDITITRIKFESNSNNIIVKSYGYVISSFECGYTWFISGIYAGEDVEDIPANVDDIYNSLQYSKMDIYPKQRK